MRPCLHNHHFLLSLIVFQRPWRWNGKWIDIFNLEYEHTWFCVRSDNPCCVCKCLSSVYVLLGLSNVYLRDRILCHFPPSYRLERKKVKGPKSERRSALHSRKSVGNSGNVWREDHLQNEDLIIIACEDLFSVTAVVPRSQRAEVREVKQVKVVKSHGTSPHS